MPLSQSNLRTMAAAASTIPERASSHIVTGKGETSEKLLQERLNAWCHVSAAGDWQRFQQRLSWDKLDFADMQRLLAPVEWSEQVPLPAWTTTLQEALQLLESRQSNSLFAVKEQWAFLDTSKPLPFEELLAPFVVLAQRRFLEQVGRNSHLLADAAAITLQRHLLHVLTSLSVQTLHHEFTHSQAQAQAATTMAEDHEPMDERSFYQRFLQQMRQGEMATMLCRYSVLARLLATTCDLWVSANVEFVQRLSADWSALEHMFGVGSNLGQVIEIQPTLSDTHAGRRNVMALTFASGCKLIYKPQPVGMEEAFSQLLHWCNGQGALPPFKTLSILNRSTYGWVEFVSYEPCPDGHALRRYYRRTGMLLCLVYLLGGVDCSYDQFIAHGEQLVLVDVSHLLHAYPRPHPERQQGEDWEQEAYSVLHTGLLASWSAPSTRYTVNDISGLGLGQRNQGAGIDSRQTSLPPQQTLKHGSLRPRSPLHIPTLLDASELAEEDELHGELCQGFQDLYVLLLQQRATLLASENPLQALKMQQVRFAYRDRSVYDQLFPALLAPQALQDGVMRSLLLERLGANCIPIEWFRMGTRDHAHWWSVFALEREALLQGEIPVVNVRTQSDGLLLASGQEVASCLCQPSFDVLLQHVQRLSEEDLAQQLALLQQALPRQHAPVLTIREGTEQHGTADRSAFLIPAIAIADSLVEHAVTIGQGNVTWVYAAFSQRFQRYQLQPMSYGYADGISGVALFLAALAKQTGLSNYRKIAWAALKPLHHLIRDDSARLVREMGLGAAQGLGSLVYALTRSSQLLDEPELLADARAAANLLTSELIAGDSLLDVHLGVAGALLGLLALYEVSPEQATLDRAVWCGQHLLRTRTPSKVGCRAWPTLSSVPTTGFAHGTAGIVYALLRLYAATRDAEILEAAREALHYEDRAFVDTYGNWAEIAGEEGSDFGISWCHGAPGIGLARLGGLPMLDTPAIRRDLEIALQTTQKIGVIGVDHLCCGTCGRVDLLLTAAQRLERPELAAIAASWMKQVLVRAGQKEMFFLNLLLPRWVMHPQLLQGASGIGYTLLRLAQPDALPSPLLWE